MPAVKFAVFFAEMRLRGGAPVVAALDPADDSDAVLRSVFWAVGVVEARNLVDPLGFPLVANFVSDLQFVCVDHVGISF